MEWLLSALNELTTFWTQANSELRTLITQAASEIDRRLETNPLEEGESRPGGRRITFVPPLAVRFSVASDGLKVTVLHVRVYGKRQK